MDIFIDACLAMMSAVGIWALGRICFDALMDDSSIWTVICACGDGEELERIVRWQLRRTRSSRVMLVDCGLSDRGQHVARSLTEQGSKVCFYPSSQTGIWIREAVEWSTIRSKMK